MPIEQIENKKDSLIKEVCRAFGVDAKYLRLSSYSAKGEIVKRASKLNEHNKPEIEITTFRGEMVTICTAGGERARLLYDPNGKIITECRGCIGIYDSIKNVEKLEPARITGDIPKRRKKN